MSSTTPAAIIPSVVVAASKYTGDIIENFFVQLGWNVHRFDPDDISKASEIWSMDAATLVWIPYRWINWDYIIEHHIIVNHHFARTGLVIKSKLYRLLQSYEQKTGTEIAKFVPKTRVFSIEGNEQISQTKRAAVLEAIKKMINSTESEELWVLKPSDSSNANDILFFNGIEQVDRMLSLAQRREWVVQSCVKSPMLIDGCKCHLRLFVLSIGRKVYVHKYPIFLMASHKYNLEDPADLLSHATNHSLQIRLGEQGHVPQSMLLTELNEAKEQGRVSNVTKSAEDIFESICGVVKHTFSAAAGNSKVFLPLPRSYQMLGLDFIIDEVNSDVWLLEVNADPDVEVYDVKEIEIARKMMANVLTITLESIEMTMRTQHFALTTEFHLIDLE